MDRAEHLAWAKTRALQELDGQGTTEQRIARASSSMQVDLMQHPELIDHAGLHLGALELFGGTMNTVDKTKHWIEGFH